MSDRYDSSGNIENEYQPGSDGRVLRNKLEISDPELIEALELELFEIAVIWAMENLTVDFRFTIDFIYELHRYWLDLLYDWAGRPRTVLIEKAGVTYRAPAFIDREMARFNEDVLAKYTPCTFESLHDIAEAMAVVHGEFEIIHPFREGNGRIGRLIASLMANQAGYTAENLSEHIKANWERYIEGLKEAWGSDYDILSGIFEEVLIQEVED